MNQEYKKVKSSKIPEFLRDSPVLDLSEKYVFIPKDKYIKTLEVKSIEDYIKILNAMDYFSLDFSDFLKEFEMNNSEEVLAYLLQIRELPYARERIDLIQKNLLKSKTYYTAVVSTQSGGEISLFDSGIFDNIKDCIDSLIIYLTSRKMIVDEPEEFYEARLGEDLSSVILETLGEKKSNKKISLNTEIKRIDFLIKHVKNTEDLSKVCRRFSYFYESCDSDYEWTFFIFERNIGSVYLKKVSEKLNIKNKDIIYMKNNQGPEKIVDSDSSSDSDSY